MRAKEKVPNLVKSRREFATKLAALPGEAARLALWRTMHELAAAVREVGYEVKDVEQSEEAARSRKAK